MASFMAPYQAQTYSILRIVSGLLFLLHGVTTVRLAGGTGAGAAQDWERRVAAGELPGPRFFTCGPILDDISVTRVIDE